MAVATQRDQLANDGGELQSVYETLLVVRLPHQVLRRPERSFGLTTVFLSTGGRRLLGRPAQRPVGVATDPHRVLTTR